MRLALLIALCALPAAAADIAVLHSGARLRAERIEKSEATYVLHTADGRIELDAAQVAGLEHEAEPSPTPVGQASRPVGQPANPPDPRTLVTQAALRHGLPPEIVHALAATESAYQAGAVSPKGAIGVMQLMPDTARQLNADPASVEQNIDAGTRLLRDLLLKYQDQPNPVSRALAAYNAGSGAVSRYNGVPPYRETQVYVERVLARYWKQVNGSQAKR